MQSQIENAYKIAAKIVSIYGEGYLPLFERLHNELQEITSKQSIKNIALQVASR